MKQSLLSCAYATNEQIKNLEKSLQDNPNDQAKQVFLEQAEKRLEKIFEFFPHGSGIDFDYNFCTDQWTEFKIVFKNKFHAMDESGYYDRIIPFTVTIKPSFFGEYDISIVGRFSPEYQHIKEYLIELYSITFDKYKYDTEKHLFFDSYANEYVKE